MSFYSYHAQIIVQLARAYLVSTLISLVDLVGNLEAECTAFLHHLNPARACTNTGPSVLVEVPLVEELVSGSHYSTGHGSTMATASTGQAQGLCPKSGNPLMFL